jgi:hypothetical protein
MLVNLTGTQCLVTIRNTTVTATVPWTEDCYIEVFFIGQFTETTIDPSIDPTIYKSSTIISSLRWSATAEFMNFNLGQMLNCTNHSPF